MNTNQRVSNWLALSIFFGAITWAGPLHATVVSSVQSGDWENTATWSCACVPGAGDTITISTGTTVKLNSTRHTGDLTVNGTLDTNNQFLEFEGTTFANNASIICVAGNFGEIDFNGVGAGAGTTQTISGTGVYTSGGPRPVEIHIINGTIVTPAIGTVISGVRKLAISAPGTLSLANMFVFADGAINSVPGSIISGTGTLRTQGVVTLSFLGTTIPSLEVASGTTTAAGNFGSITIGNGATLAQGGTVTTMGNVTVASNGILDTRDGFFEFEGATFFSDGSIISSVGSFGEIDFNGMGGVMGTGQTIGGTGVYATASFPVEIHVINGTTLTTAGGTVMAGVRNLAISAPGTLSLSNAFVFVNGAINSAANSTISGAGTLQTQGMVTLFLGGNTLVPLEVDGGITTVAGNFGQVAIDNGAKLVQAGTVTTSGDVIVANSGILDTADGFFEFKGATFTNNGSIVCSTGFGLFDFSGAAGVAGTTQNLSGTGSYNTNGRNDIRLLNNVTVTVASGTILNGVTNLTIDSGTTFGFTGSGGMTMAGTVTNSGTVNLNGGAPACGDATRILLRSSVMGVQRAWSGGGNFLMADLDVQDQTSAVPITVLGGIDSGNNGADWMIFATCSIPTPTPVPTPSQLLNISTRMRVQTGYNALIGGFIITGTDPKRVIIRGIGPSLSSSISGALEDPTLELYQGSTLLAMNDNWRDTQAAEIQGTGLQPGNDFESAVVATLTPGAYTIIVRGKNDTTGIGLVEAYDLNQAANSTLANISTRGFVETGDNAMIGGFIVGPVDGESANVLVRAIGPSLSSQGIPGTLQDPTLALVNSNGVVVRSNNDWRESQESQIIATGVPPTDDHESALVETVVPGGYTAIVRGNGDTTGVALVEVYRIP